METTATKLRTILLVGILSISMLSAGIGSVGAAPAHSSIGSVSVDDRSAAGSTPAPPADPDEWDLRSATHSGTMSAEIIIDENTLRGITITDDVNHEGRDVSISRDALSGWIEEIPDQVSGVHEDGSRWSSDVRISGDRVVVYVPEFSTQTITFSSRVSITADPAEDGSSFEYELNDTNVTDSSLSLTGSLNNDQDIYSTVLADGESVGVDVGGTTDADAQVTIKGNTTTSSRTKRVNETTGGDYNIDVDGSETPKNQTITAIGYSGEFTDYTTNDKTETLAFVNTDSSSGGYSWDITDIPDGATVNKLTVNVSTAYFSGASYIDVSATVGGEDYGETRISSSGVHNFSGPEVTANNGISVSLDGVDSDGSGLGAEARIDARATSASEDEPQASLIGDSTGSVDVSIDGQTYSFDSLSGSETVAAEFGSGSYNSNVAISSGRADVIWSWDEASTVTSPSVDIDEQTVSTNSDLGDGERYSENISLSTGSKEAIVNLGSNSNNPRVDINVSETTETIDPSITISSDAGSQIVDYSGTLSDGSTADLSNEIDNSQIGGNVSISVSVSESVSSGPLGQVGLDYAHDAQESKQIDYSGEEFSERYSFSHTWPHDRPSASITIPWASDRVVDVRSVKVNGQETTQYSAADGELIVDLGSVQSGDQTNVTAVGSKVSVSGGAISVDDPTTQGEDLDSGISVQSLSEQTLEIDVSDSYHVDERDRMIYVPDSSASWTGADPITRIEPGSQTVEIDPTSSSSFRLRSAGVGSSIPSGDAILRMEDAAEPRVSVSPGRTEGDTLKLTYHNTVSGDYYRVVDSEGNPLDTDQAESPAEFRISDTAGVFSIEQFTPEAIVSGISSGAAAVSSGDSLIPPWLALIATLSVSILGLAYASTRTEIGSSMLGRRVIIGGGIVLGYVGAELVTGERLYRLALDGVSGFISSALGAGAGAGSGAISGLADIGFISLVLGIGLLVGLYAIDQRTGIDIPRAGWGIAAGLISVWVISQLGLGTGVSIGGQQSLSIVLAIGIVLGLLALDQRGILSIPLPLYAGTALLAGVYVLETLAPGSVLGPLQSGLDEVGPLIWLAIIGGALLLLWVWLRSNRPEITIPGLRGGNR